MRPLLHQPSHWCCHQDMVDVPRLPPPSEPIVSCCRRRAAAAAASTDRNHGGARPAAPRFEACGLAPAECRGERGPIRRVANPFCSQTVNDNAEEDAQEDDASDGERASRAMKSEFSTHMRRSGSGRRRFPLPLFVPCCPAAAFAFTTLCSWSWNRLPHASYRSLPAGIMRRTQSKRRVEVGRPKIAAAGLSFAVLYLEMKIVAKRNRKPKMLPSSKLLGLLAAAAVVVLLLHSQQLPGWDGKEVLAGHQRAQAQPACRLQGVGGCGGAGTFAPPLDYRALFNSSKSLEVLARVETGCSWEHSGQTSDLRIPPVLHFGASCCQTLVRGGSPPP